MLGAWNTGAEQPACGWGLQRRGSMAGGNVGEVRDLDRECTVHAITRAKLAKIVRTPSEQRVI